MGYRWRRTRQSLRPFRNQQLFESKAKELDSLIDLHKEGFIDLYYLYYGDESHFGLTSNVPYAWQHKDSQILIPCRKSNRLTVFGLLTIDSKMEHYTIQGCIKSNDLGNYLDLFNEAISKKTVIVLDNAPIHRSKLFKSKIIQWQKQDLYIFFLPPYSPELNKIEILWRFIKYKWLPLDAFLNFQNLKDHLNDILHYIGVKYVINFYGVLKIIGFDNLA
ncbi:IS630 family transposase [Dysgonomonas sp. Marseille-P4677]|uniref:IS630 family transposase n=1 Tax=Dysgonomonas sp. Marseille-P4677 TaxID=2364790 RepID=UPI001F401CD4|nr:IS630 family transposase [Dysgonomonas sp. Marseille-P4677]